MALVDGYLPFFYEILYTESIDIICGVDGFSSANCAPGVINPIVTEAIHPNDLVMYPSATSGTIYLKGKNITDRTVVLVYNSMGIQILQETGSEGARMELNIGDNPSGIYFVHVLDEFGNVFIKQVILQP